MILAKYKSICVVSRLSVKLSLTEKHNPMASTQDEIYLPLVPSNTAVDFPESTLGYDENTGELLALFVELLALFEPCKGLAIVK